MRDKSKPMRSTVFTDKELPQEAKSKTELGVRDKRKIKETQNVRAIRQTMLFVSKCNPTGGGSRNRTQRQALIQTLPETREQKGHTSSDEHKLRTGTSNLLSRKARIVSCQGKPESSPTYQLMCELVSTLESSRSSAT